MTVNKKGGVVRLTKFERERATPRGGRITERILTIIAPSEVGAGLA
jgi:hypothetical protein